MGRVLDHYMLVYIRLEIIDEGRMTYVLRFRRASAVKLSRIARNSGVQASGVASISLLSLKAEAVVAANLVLGDCLVPRPLF
jgi:hypothetical protein